MKKIARIIGFYLNVLAYLAPRAAGRIGFNLFCTPTAPPVKPHHLDFLDTAEQTTVDYQGHRIQTYRWGRGPKKVLFLHGWQSHSFRWKNYIDAFPKDEYTMYAMDAPAHGLSEGKYISLPIYSGAIEKFISQIHPIHTVVSHSFGSFASLHSFHCHPELAVGRLIIMGSPGEATDFMEFYRGMLGLTEQTIKLVLAYFEQKLGHGPSYYSAPAFAKAVKIPGLIIHDEGDEEAPFRYALAIHAAWEKSTLMVTSGVGHNLKSKEVVERVVAFVEEKEAVESSQVSGFR